MTEHFLPDEPAMLAFGEHLVTHFNLGDIVLFEGDLGTGKTTMIRGMLRGLGVVEPVRSPTYNLFSLYETTPPVLHADLYRVQDAQGTGIEDYFDTHLCLVEWPLALRVMLELHLLPTVSIEYNGDGRMVRLRNINLSNIKG